MLKLKDWLLVCIIINTLNLPLVARVMMLLVTLAWQVALQPHRMIRVVLSLVIAVVVANSWWGLGDIKTKDERATVERAINEIGAIEGPSQSRLGTTLEGYACEVQADGLDLYIYKGPWAMKVRILVRGQALSPQACTSLNGAYVKISKAKAMTIDAANFDGFNYQKYLRAFDYQEAYLAKGQNIVVSMPSGSDKYQKSLAFTLRKWRCNLQAFAAKRSAMLGPEGGQLYSALFLGVEAANDTFDKQLQVTGLLHLFVVSGFHFGVVLGALYAAEQVLSPLFGRSYWWGLVLRLAGAAGYYAMCWSGLGSWRALAALALGCLAFALKRPLTRAQSLEWLAILALLWSPRLLGQFAFDVTFVATAIMGMAHTKGQGNNRTGQVPLATKQHRTHQSMKKHVPETLKSMGLGLAVFIGVFPWLHSSFGTTNGLSILFTALISPLVSLYVVLSTLWFTVWPLGSIFGNLDTALACLINNLGHIITQSIDLFSRVAPLDIPVVAALAMTGQVGLLVAIGLWRFPLFSHHRALKGLMAAALIASLSGALFLGRTDWGLSLRAYALLDGEAYLLRGPGLTLLYDVGNDKSLLALLEQAGVYHLDYVVISHGHLDHMGLLKDLKVRYPKAQIIFEPPQIPLSLKHFEIDFYRGLPNHNSPINPNETSLAMYVTYKAGAFSKHYTMLFTGDLEEGGIDHLISECPFKVDWLKIPHHGSHADNEVALLEHFDPKIAAISGGRGKRIDKGQTYGDLFDSKIEFYDTMVEGEVFLNLLPFFKAPIIKGALHN